MRGSSVDAGRVQLSKRVQVVAGAIIVFAAAAADYWVDVIDLAPLTRHLDGLFFSGLLGASLLFGRAINRTVQPHSEVKRGPVPEIGSQSLLQENALERDLCEAISEGQIRPHYQPIVSLADRELLGFEVLARWCHPDRGTIAPDVFIPLAEETGLITQLSYTLLKQVCRDARSWPSQLSISFNVSARQLAARDFADQLLGILAQGDIAPQRLVLEITEGHCIEDLETARATLQSLRDNGVRIALDDFGIGYSSLLYLRELPIDIIKIDRSFVQSLREGSKKEERLVSAITNVGKILGLSITAEGVESAEEARQLFDLGCQCGQGYHFGKPVSAVDVKKILAPRGSWTGRAGWDDQAGSSVDTIGSVPARVWSGQRGGSDGWRMPGAAAALAERGLSA
jgi:EAL domain-containing protein (putative c-di-GMP-specific phosphodiesterase class I)